MYPILFRIGHFAISTYGVIVALGVLAATTLLERGLRDRGLDGDRAWTLFVYALVGGFLGAKAYFVALHGDPGAFFSRAGLVWYGGLIGGAAAMARGIRRTGLPLGATADALAPAAALGHGIGHLGCFFSGDSYGLPSNLPWAVAFPHGAPPSTAGALRNEFGVHLPASIPDSQLMTVHPTMLYSATVLLLIAGLLWWLRRSHGPPGWLFGLYLVLAGTERFFVEFLRAKDDRFLWGFSTAQAVAVILIAAGALLLRVLFARRRGRAHGGDPAGTARRPAPETAIGKV